MEHIEFTFQNPVPNCLPKIGQFLANYPRKNNESELSDKIAFPQIDHLVMKNVVLTILPVVFPKKPKDFCLNPEKLKKFKTF